MKVSVLFAFPGPIILLALMVIPVSTSGEEIPVEIRAWNEFCDSLKASGAKILETYPQRHEVDRAEGPLFLAQQLSIAIEQTFAARDRAFPLLRIGATDLNKAGFDGADAKYLGAPIEGTGTYRLSGTLGNARLIAIQAVAMGPPYAAFASLSSDGLSPDPQGRVEIMLGPEQPEGWTGPWLATDARATDLMVREYFGDWLEENPSTLTLERLDPVETDAALSMERSRETLQTAAARFAGRAPLWQPMVVQIRERLRNRLSPPASPRQGLSDNFYGSGWFALEPGQALLIEFDAPEALLWSFQLGNFWWESLDYVSRTGSLNGDQAVPSSDGRYRIVIAGEDPWVPNWLDTGGRPEGAINFRYQRSQSKPTPTMRLISLEELRSELPKDTPIVSKKERRAEIAARRSHAARRWAP
ncbi:DUF1214 domain-containing protein [Myxococcota bacterium]|nr:DUF1214 domain-containing protein [Myxococcota bacterium]